jgi:hypothetical protein
MRFVLKEVHKKHLSLIPGGGGQEVEPEIDPGAWDEDPGSEFEMNPFAGQLLPPEKPKFTLVKNKETP